MELRGGAAPSLLEEKEMRGGALPAASWRFLTNHALVLIYIGRRPDSTGLEIAHTVGITERAVRKILAELQSAGYIATERIGRRNRYRVDVSRPVRRVGERELTVGELLAIVPDEPVAMVGEAVSATERSAATAGSPRQRNGTHVAPDL